MHNICGFSSPLILTVMFFLKFYTWRSFMLLVVPVNPFPLWKDVKMYIQTFPLSVKNIGRFTPFRMRDFVSRSKTFDLCLPVVSLILIWLSWTFGVMAKSFSSIVLCCLHSELNFQPQLLQVFLRIAKQQCPYLNLSTVHDKSRACESNNCDKTLFLLCNW